MRIGYERDSYPERRLIIGKIPDVEYVQVPRGELPGKGKLFSPDQLEFTSCFEEADCDLLHFMNNINFGKKAYVSHFESVLPRYFTSEASKVGAAVVARDCCRKIIAISQNAAGIMRSRTASLPARQARKILDKMVVLHPPQKSIPNDPERFRNPEPLKLIFIGGLFIGKSGLQVLKVLAKIRKKYSKIELTVISGLATDPRWCKAEDCIRAGKFMVANADWIHWYPYLPNEAILSMLGEYHLGLLPSLRETYGFSVLEMQAACVPVITTNIRAFPEINSPETGWLLELPSGGEVYAPYGSDSYLEAAVRIEVQLEAVLRDILRDPSVLALKSAQAGKRIREHHDPVKYAARLKDIYSKALN
ncbi:glycosyltransferase family 4 protein [Desulfovibrio sp. OttesenSCG-928-A18]|nr:glycosyltransferase family 4 protein [Desulfovibrio sp. OttesenSCG-928-A18]